MLEKIRTLLEELDENVYYGISTHEEDEKWDYMVFNRKKIRPSSKNKLSFTYTYSITIVREENIKEDFEQEVINKIVNNTNLRIADNEFMYNYILKSGTNEVVELLTIDFIEAKRRVDCDE